MGILDLFRKAREGDPDPVTMLVSPPASQMVARGAVMPAAINGRITRERCEGRIARLKAKLARQLERGADDDALEETQRSIRHYEARLTLLETQG